MRRGVSDHRRLWAPILLAITLLVLCTALWREAGSDRPMSVVDEHMHLDTHVRVHQGTYPHRGSLMSMPVVRAWACGVGHEGGAAMAPCDHPDLGPNSLPSGIYATGYIHYPTYFVAAEGYRAVASALGGGTSWIDTYRHFAALVTSLGLLACLAGAWRLGFRGSRLVAATLAPSAAVTILLYGTIANPQSAGVLCGALIAWSGLRWALTGRGFWWLAAATALAASVAVVQSLPAGVFIVATVLALLLRRLGWDVPGPWRPRWWQPAVLGVLVVTPVVVFGRWISEHATLSNSELYAFVAAGSWQSILTGAVSELSVLHSPWVDSSSSLAVPQEGSLVRHLLRASVQGVPMWITVLVFAPLVLVAVRHAARSRGARTLAVVPLLVIAALISLMLYPPALRVSNAINVGIDHPIVSRYSISFTPLLVWLFLLATRQPVATRLLAGLATAGTLFVALAVW